jgi:hypothetical protein
LIFSYRFLSLGQSASSASSSREFELALVLIRRRDRGFEFLRHSLQVGDLPFQWGLLRSGDVHVGSNPGPQTEQFFSRTISNSQVDAVASISLLDPRTIERGLASALEKNLPAACRPHYVSVDPNAWTDLPAEEVDIFWSAIVPEISTHTKCYYSTKGPLVVESRQSVLCRYFFGQKFDCGLVTLFFFLLKAAESLLEAADANVMHIIQLHGFADLTLLPPKVLLFFASCTTRFGDLLSTVGSLQFSVWSQMETLYSRIPRQFTPPSQAPLVQLKSPIRAILKLKNSSLFCPTMSIASFVVTQNMDDCVLVEHSTVPQNINLNDPVVIKLSEPCFVREIVLQGCNATQLSVSGGLFLNRLFPIASDVFLCPDRTLRLSLEPAASYERDLRVFDHELVQYVSLTFQSQFESNTITSVSVFGRPNRELDGVLPEPIGRDSFEDRGRVNYDDCYTVDTAFAWENRRLLHLGDIAEFLGRVTSVGGLPLDAFDLDQLHSLHRPEGLAKKQACERCRKDAVNQCWGCQSPFCAECMRVSGKKVPLCDACLGDREMHSASLAALEALKLRIAVSLFPFVVKHRKLCQAVVPSSQFRRIDRMPIASVLYELPRGEDGALPFTSEVWCPSSNFFQVHLSLVCQCDVEGIAVECLSPLVVTIEGSEPSIFRFEPPGFRYRLKFRGTVVVMVLSGDAIQLKSINFFGTPLIPAAIPYAARADVPIDRPPFVEEPLTVAHFNKDEDAFAVEFDSVRTVLGVRFPNVGLFGRLMVFEARHGPKRKVIPATVAVPKDPVNCTVFLQGGVKATKFKVMLSRLPEKWAPAGPEDVPVVLLDRVKGREGNPLKRRTFSVSASHSGRVTSRQTILLKRGIPH